MILLGNAKTTYNLSKITERLYCGGLIYDENEYQFLVKEGITHIINAALTESNDAEILKLHPQMKYLFVGEPDDGQPKPKEWFDKTIRFTLEAYQTPGTIVYVHCAAGVNRGPSLAYAILRAIGLSRSEAFDTIKLNRPQAMIGYKVDADRALIELGWTDDGVIGYEKNVQK